MGITENFSLGSLGKYKSKSPNVKLVEYKSTIKFYNSIQKTSILSPLCLRLQARLVPANSSGTTQGVGVCLNMKGV